MSEVADDDNKGKVAGDDKGDTFISGIPDSIITGIFYACVGALLLVVLLAMLAMFHFQLQHEVDANTQFFTAVLA